MQIYNEIVHIAKYFSIKRIPHFTLFFKLKMYLEKIISVLLLVKFWYKQHLRVANNGYKFYIELQKLNVVRAHCIYNNIVEEG